MSTNTEEDSPDNWIVKKSRSQRNKTYFYNNKTKKSQWKEPEILKAGIIKDPLPVKRIESKSFNNNNNNKSQKSINELLSINSKSGIHKQSAQDRLKNIQTQLIAKNLTKTNIKNKEIVKLVTEINTQKLPYKMHIQPQKYPINIIINKNNNIDKSKLSHDKNQYDGGKTIKVTNLASKRLENLQKKQQIEQQQQQQRQQKTQETTSKKVEKNINLFDNNDIEMYDDNGDEQQQPINNTDNTIMEWEDIDYTNLFNEIQNVRQNNPENDVKRNLFERPLPQSTDESTTNEFNLINLNNLDKCLNNQLYIVIDTNVFLSNLKFIEKLPTIYFKNIGYPIIIVPYIVLCELDKIKHRKDSTLKILAIQSIKFLYEKFKNNNQNYYGQNILDTYNKLITIDNPDDNILNCCLQIKNCTKNIILLTNDINLLNKAFCCAINGYTKNELEIDYNKIELK